MPTGYPGSIHTIPTERFESPTYRKLQNCRKWTHLNRLSHTKPVQINSTLIAIFM